MNKEKKDKLINKEFKALNKGFVKLIDYSGEDSSIVNAARVSYGKGTKTKREDDKLLDYLYKNKHMSPFEMCDITLHIKCPIFVARQWMRHRGASYNEISGRYSVMRNEYYIPDIENLKKQSKSNKQGRDDEIVEEAELLQMNMSNIIKEIFLAYEEYIEKYDLTRELARIVLPMATYTEFFYKTNLRSLLNFLSLRNDDHAQCEIRQYAKIIEDNILKALFPVTYQAFKTYK